MFPSRQFFQIMHQFRSLRIHERLHLLPRGECMILQMLISRKASGDTNTSLSASHIARRLHVTAPAVSRTMRNLREQGYITVDPDPKDRRNACVQITDIGREAVSSELQSVDDLIERATARLEPGEFEQLVNIFERLHQSMTLELDALEK